MSWVYNDGGRAIAGYKGETGDCVCRAIAIATDMPYREVYNLVNKYGKAVGKRSSARTGPPKEAINRLMRDLGWKWIVTMGIGTGCQVHLDPDELPMGRLVTRLSGHVCAVIDGVIHDTYDPSRDGTRCVYGYFINE